MCTTNQILFSKAKKRRRKDIFIAQFFTVLIPYKCSQMHWHIFHKFISGLISISLTYYYYYYYKIMMMIILIVHNAPSNKKQR